MDTEKSPRISHNYKIVRLPQGTQFLFKAIVRGKQPDVLYKVIGHTPIQTGIPSTDTVIYLKALPSSPPASQTFISLPLHLLIAEGIPKTDGDVFWEDLAIQNL